MNPVKYLKEAQDELRKVVWPTKELVQKHTILVIAISLFIALYFTGLDYLLNLALEAVL
jgi:preprotein translocase subunit SecE